MIKLTKNDMLELTKETEREYINKPGDPIITKEEAMNLAIQMKKIQDEELKNPKPIYDEYGLLIMDDEFHDKCN